MFKLYKIKYYCEKCNICLYYIFDYNNNFNKYSINNRNTEFKCPICDTINKRLELFRELQN